MTTAAYLKLIDDTLTFLGNPHTFKEIPSLSLPSCKKEPPSKKILEKPNAPPSSKPPFPVRNRAEQLSPLTLEKPSLNLSISEEKWRKLFKTALRDIYLHERVPSDQKAQRLKEAWKEKHNTPEVPILIQGSFYKTFLQNLAKAIETEFFPCRLVEIDHLEKEKKWDLFLKSPQLKLIIAPDQLIFGNKELLPFYKEHPQQGVRFLGNTPLLLIPDLSLYFKDPYLKRSLWNVICQALKPKHLPPSY